MSSFKRNVEYLGLDIRKEILFYALTSSVLLAMGVGLFVYRGLSWLLLFPILASLLYTYYFFSRYSAFKRKKLAGLCDEFVKLFTFFGIYVNDGFTIYNALGKLLDYGSEEMNGYLKALLSDIDEDKSVTPYVKFASHFEDLSIKEVMLSVYQMVDEGEGGVYIHQFQRLFNRLSDSRHQLEKDKRIERLDTLSFLPLCGSGIAMLSLTLCLFEIMGDLFDGI